MNGFRRFALVLLVVGAAAAASAFNPQPDPPGFGLVGIVRGQTARLNVAAVGPENNDGPSHMRVLLGFVDAAGNVVGFPAEVRLRPGEGAYADFVLSPREAGRRQIRAVVKLLHDGREGDLPPGPTRAVATLEVFDTASGQTVFVLPGTESCFREVDPAPEK